jgi:hypothetical protein
LEVEFAPCCYTAVSCVAVLWEVPLLLSIDNLMGCILLLAPIVPKSLLQWACWEPESAVPRPLPSRLDCCYLNSFVHNIADWYANLGCVERPNHKARSKHVCFSWVVKITSREHDDEKKKVLAMNHSWWNKDWTANICHIILTWVPFWCQTHLCRTRWMFNNKIPQKCSTIQHDGVMLKRSQD